MNGNMKKTYNKAKKLNACLWFVYLIIILVKSVFYRAEYDFYFEILVKDNILTVLSCAFSVLFMFMFLLKNNKICLKISIVTFLIKPCIGIYYLTSGFYEYFSRYELIDILISTIVPCLYYMFLIFCVFNEKITNSKFVKSMLLFSPALIFSIRILCYGVLLNVGFVNRLNHDVNIAHCFPVDTIEYLIECIALLFTSAVIFNLAEVDFKKLKLYKWVSCLGIIITCLSCVDYLVLLITKKLSVFAVFSLKPISFSIYVILLILILIGVWMMLPCFLRIQKTDELTIDKKNITIKCPKCNSIYYTSVNFCVKCGFPLSKK